MNNNENLIEVPEFRAKRIIGAILDTGKFIIPICK